jgi:hypothetical protein
MPFKKMKTLCSLACIVLFSSNVFAQGNYEVVKRFKLLEDKFRTTDMLNAPGHDFYLELGALVNKNLTTFIDEAEEVENPDSNVALANAQAFLRKYDKTEQNARIRFGVGVPLPSFTIFGAKIKPNFRVGIRAGILMGIRSESFTVADALSFLPSDLDPAVQAVLNTCNFVTPGLSAGEDIVQYAVTNCGLNSTIAAPYLDKYKYPTDDTVPLVHNYVNGEGRAGLYFDYAYAENWWGSFNIYAMGRADARMIVSADTLAGKEEIGDVDFDNNKVDLTTDLKFGYKNGSLKGFAAIEDIKLATMADNEAESGVPLYGDDVMFRLHGEYIYELSNFDVKAFGGTHYRSGYDVGDGYYLGADLRLHVWAERMKLRVRGMLDGEHFTFSPMMDLWLIRLEYVLKQPLSSDVDGVKPSTLHSLNLRLEF